MAPRPPKVDWTKKGATLSHQSVMKEFGLTEKEIFAAVKQGKLQYRENNIYGNPFLRLLRFEVENYVKQKHGADFLKKQKKRNELKKLETELRTLKSRIHAIEKRKKELTKDLNR